MKKLFIPVAALSVMFAASLPTFAAEKATSHEALEKQCKEMAHKEKVPTDKQHAYIKSCVEKHSQKTTGMPTEGGTAK